MVLLWPSAKHASLFRAAKNCHARCGGARNVHLGWENALVDRYGIWLGNKAGLLARSAIRARHSELVVSDVLLARSWYATAGRILSNENGVFEPNANTTDRSQRQTGYTPP